VAKGAGQINEFAAAVDAVPAGGDKAVTVDLQKSTGGGAFATLLTAVITINSASSAKTKYTGTLVATPTFVAGDLLRIVVALTGTTGNQAQGLVARAVVQENPS
jgi:hypothetical protein